MVESYWYAATGELTLAQKGTSGKLEATSATGTYYDAFGQLTRSVQAREETAAKAAVYFCGNSGGGPRLGHPRVYDRHGVPLEE